MICPCGRPSCEGTHQKPEPLLYGANGQPLVERDPPPPLDRSCRFCGEQAMHVSKNDVAWCDADVCWVLAGCWTRVVA